MRTKQPTKYFVPLQKLSKPPSRNLLLTVPRRLFCCGSLLPVFSVRVSVMFHLTYMYVHIILVRFGLLSGHLLGNSSLG